MALAGDANWQVAVGGAGLAARRRQRYKLAGGVEQMGAGVPLRSRLPGGSGGQEIGGYHSLALQTGGFDSGAAETGGWPFAD